MDAKLNDIKWKKGDVVLCIRHKRNLSNMRETIEEEVTDTLKSMDFEEFMFAEVLTDADPDEVTIGLGRRTTKGGSK